MTPLTVSLGFRFNLSTKDSCIEILSPTLSLKKIAPGKGSGFKGVPLWAKSPLASGCPLIKRSKVIRSYGKSLSGILNNWYLDQRATVDELDALDVDDVAGTVSADRLRLRGPCQSFHMNRLHDAVAVAVEQDRAVGAVHVFEVNLIESVLRLASLDVDTSTAGHTIPRPETAASVESVV